MNIRKGMGWALGAVPLAIDNDKRVGWPRKVVGWAIVGALVWLLALPWVGILLHNLGWYD